MGRWGTVPEWITAAVASASLKYLVDYAKSAKEQVGISKRQAREQMRPILVVTELRYLSENYRAFRVENQGVGAALDIRWQSQGEPTQLDSAFGPTLVLGPKSSFEDSFTSPAHTKQ
jgi:hypothetical protein